MTKTIDFRDPETGYFNLDTIRHLKARRTGLLFRRLVRRVTAVCVSYVHPEPGDELVYVRQDGAVRVPKVAAVAQWTDTPNVYTLTLEWP